MMYTSPNRPHHRNNIGFLCEFLNAKQSFKLLKSYGYGCTTHKANNGSMRQEVNQETQSANPSDNYFSGYVKKGRYIWMLARQKYLKKPRAN